MKSLNLKRSEEMLLALLRAALHQRDVETVYFQQATAEEWVQCYRLAVRQGVVALAWEGIERLPLEYAPPLDVKLSWALLEKKQVATYRKHCRVVNELTRLYAQHGIATVVLKGVGLSRLYPVPAHREGADIDIYTYSADKTRMTDEEANRLADKLIEQLGISVDYAYIKVHSSFCFQGIMFENHRRFLNVDTFTELVEADAWLKKSLSSQSVELLEGNCNVCVPSVDFDRVFVSLHAAQHYGNGLILRHLCDWVLLLQPEGLKLPQELTNKYFLQAIAVLTQLSNRYLGTYIPIEGSTPLANEMMKEIIRPPFYGKMPLGNPIKAGWYKVRFKLHLLQLRNRLLGVSLWKGTMKLLLSVLSNPSRLYR